MLPSVRPFTKLDPSNSEEQRAYALRRTVVPNFYCCCLCSGLVLFGKVIGKNEEKEEEKCALVLRNEKGGSVFATDCTCTIQFIAHEKGGKHKNNVIYEREREKRERERERS